MPTESPTTKRPTESPTQTPSKMPTERPLTKRPTRNPTKFPTNYPSLDPDDSCTIQPDNPLSYSTCDPPDNDPTDPNDVTPCCVKAGAGPNPDTLVCRNNCQSCQQGISSNDCCFAVLGAICGGATPECCKQDNSSLNFVCVANGACPS
mmetsp:Transcript_21500/g.37925  ORF Transcript_21500/g.37925 Transcript_21500/m.37925 type:complete len:149 (+) Transcript_21500:378-824(+)